jgi:hypothetical protein
MSPVAVKNRSPLKHGHKWSGKFELSNWCPGQAIVAGSNLGIEKREEKLTFTAIRWGGSGFIEAGKPTLSTPKLTKMFVICNRNSTGGTGASATCSGFITVIRGAPLDGGLIGTHQFAGCFAK